MWVFMSSIKKNNLFLLEEIVKKNFSSKYKDSVLGIFWSILRPLLLMLLFTIIFSTIFKKNIENYEVYFLSGWCLFIFFTGAISVSMGSLKANKNIILKTPAPRHIFVLGSIISEFFNFIITILLLACVMIITHASFYWSTIAFSIIPIISLTIMITGIGLMLSVACVYYTDIQHLWGVVTLVLMYGTCIFYPIEIIPEPYRHYVMLNPLFWVIDQFRCCVFYGNFPPMLDVINSLLLSVIILILGIIIFKKYEKKISMKF